MAVARSTLSDVASAAGVSAQTVSRVLNHHPSVRDATRSKVLAAAKALNYTPNLAARSLASGATGSVGVLLTAALSHGMSATFSALARTACERKKELVVASAFGEEPATLQAAITQLRGHRVEAIVVLTQHTELLPFLALESSSEHFVALMSGKQRFESMSTVYIDQSEGARLATEHLLDSGRKNILHVAGDLCWQDSHERLAAYKQVCAEAGVAARWIPTDSWGGAAGERAAEQILVGEIPDAILAGNDDIALGICRVLLQHGIRIPEDVAIVGFDDLPQSRWVTPSLSSVFQDFDALGAEALNVLDSPDARGQSFRIVPNLIVRESSQSMN